MSAGLSEPASPSSHNTRPSASTEAEFSSPESGEDGAMVPSASHDHDEDDVSFGSLQLSSEFRKLLDEINRLGEDESQTSLEYSETDGSSVLKNDVDTSSEADVIRQVRCDDVTCRDVTGGQDAVSTEQACYRNDADDVSTHQSDGDEFTTNTAVLMPAYNEVACSDVEVMLTTDASVPLDADEPSQSLLVNSAEESNEPGRSNEECNYSSQRIDSENPFQHQSADNHQSPVVKETYSQISDCITLTNDLVVEKQSSAGSLTTDCLLELESDSTLSLSPSASLSVDSSQVDDGAALEKCCPRQWDQTFASTRMPEDTVPSETHAYTPLPSASSSSSSSSSLENSHHAETPSESQQRPDLVAESTKNGRCEFDLVNEAAFASEPDHDDDVRDVPLSCSSAELYPVDTCRDPSSVSETEDTTDMGGDYFISEISEPQGTDDDEMVSAKQSELTAAVFNTEPTDSERRTAESLANSEVHTDDDTVEGQNASSKDCTLSDDEQFLTRVEQASDKQKGINVVRLGLQGPETETDATMRIEVKADGLYSPPMSLSHPPSQLLTSFSGDDLNRDVNDLSLSGTSVMKSLNENANSSGKTFTSLSTLYIQSPAVKDNLTLLTSNDSNNSGVDINVTMAEGQLPGRSLAENESHSLNGCNGLFAAYSKIEGPQDYKVENTNSVHLETDECKQNYVDYSSHENTDAPNILQMRTVVETDSDKFVSKKSENSEEDSRSAYVNNYAPVSYSSTAPASAKRIMTTREDLLSNDNDDSSLFRTATKFATNGVTTKMPEHESQAVDKVALKSDDGLFPVSPSPSEINSSCSSNSTNSYEFKTRPQHTFTAATANTNSDDDSTVPDRTARAEDEKERAKKLLRSVLAPVCRIRATGPPSVPRHPALSGNTKVNSTRLHAADSLPEMSTTTTRRSPGSDDVVRRDSGLSPWTTRDETTVSGSYHAEQRAPWPPVSSDILHPSVTAVPLSPGYLDNNNNNKKNNKVTVERDVRSRRSRGGRDVTPPLSWRRNHVIYDFATLPPTQRRHGKLLQLSTEKCDDHHPNNQPQQRGQIVRQLSEEVHGTVERGGPLPLDDVRCHCRWSTGVRPSSWPRPRFWSRPRRVGRTTVTE